MYRRAARREAATWGRPSVAALRTDRLLFVLVSYGVDMGDWAGPRLNAWLAAAIDRERQLGPASNLPPCGLWGLCRRKATSIEPGTPRSEDEIRTCIGASPRSWTGLILSIIDRVPGRDRLIRTLVALKRKVGWY